MSIVYIGNPGSNPFKPIWRGVKYTEYRIQDTSQDILISLFFPDQE